MTHSSVLPAAAPGVLSLIGRTPLVELRRLDTGPCRLFAKLESQNPGGSIKDRIALAMIDAAEREGKLAPGATLIEATAGNTGLGLALVAAQKGYKLILVVPDKMAREKVMHVKAMGAEVVTTRSDVGKGHPEYYQDIAERIAAETPGSFWVNQFANPANPQAHYDTTAPEIHAQMEGRVDAVVAGVGSGGTLTGIGRYFRDVSPETEMVLADPVGSILAPLVNTGETIEPGSWAVEGIGEDFVPPNLDLSLVRHAYSISDDEALAATRDLLVTEGILAGSSSGTLLAAALRFCRAQTEPKRVVTLVPDSGAKYLSKVFNDAWLLEQGFVRRDATGDVRDLVTRRHTEGATITVAPTDTLRIAYARMRSADVSQLPVLDRGRLVGLVDESDLLRVISAAGGDTKEAFGRPVYEAMTTRLATLPAHAPISDLPAIFAADQVAIVVEDKRFLGLVTRVDLLNSLLRSDR